MTEPVPSKWAVPFTVTSDLPGDLGNIPMSPTIDFGQLVEEAGAPGVLDPNSIQVIDAEGGAVVAHALTEDFAYGDCGRVEWGIQTTASTRSASPPDPAGRRSSRRPASPRSAWETCCGGMPESPGR